VPVVIPYPHKNTQAFLLTVLIVYNILMIEKQELFLFFCTAAEMQIDFNDKSYLVVGGARGIGAEVCRRIARSGGNVAWTHLGNDADLKGTAELQAELKKLGADCAAKAVDCTDNLGTVQFCRELAASEG
jgi:hypothetical protein